MAVSVAAQITAPFHEPFDAAGWDTNSWTVTSGGGYIVLTGPPSDKWLAMMGGNPSNWTTPRVDVVVDLGSVEGMVARFHAGFQDPGTYPGAYGRFTISSAGGVILHQTDMVPTWPTQVMHEYVYDTTPFFNGPGTVVVFTWELHSHSSAAYSSVWLDDLILEEPPSFSYSLSQGPLGDGIVRLTAGEPNAPYFILHSDNALNAALGGNGWFFGLHLDMDDLMNQLLIASLGNPLFGGTLDSNGQFTMTVPGGGLGFLAGQTWWGVGVQQTANGLFQGSNVASITFQ